MWALRCTWAPSPAALWPPPPCCCLARCSRASSAAAVGCAPAAGCAGEGAVPVPEGGPWVTPCPPNSSPRAPFATIPALLPQFSLERRGLRLHSLQRRHKATARAVAAAAGGRGAQRSERFAGGLCRAWAHPRLASPRGQRGGTGRKPPGPSLISCCPARRAASSCCSRSAELGPQ